MLWFNHNQHERSKRVAKYKMSKLEKSIMEAAAKAGEAGFFADLEIVQPIRKREKDKLDIRLRLDF